MLNHTLLYEIQNKTNDEYTTNKKLHFVVNKDCGCLNIVVKLNLVVAVTEWATGCKTWLTLYNHIFDTI